MRIAWFHTESSAAVDRVAGTPALLSALAQSNHLDLVSRGQAHGFVVEHALRPYDVCVFEPRNTPDSDFMWAYLFQYPGVVVSQDDSLHDSRVRALERHRRQADYVEEFLFNHGHPPRGVRQGFARGTWPMLRAPFFASKLVVTGDRERRLALECAYPGLRVREVPPHAEGPAIVEDAGFGAPDEAALQVSTLGNPRPAVLRAIERARALGVPVVPASDTSVSGIDASNVVVALDGPSEASALTPVLSAMAVGKAVVVAERESTALWPALDPQTWQARGRGAAEEPMAVSLDMRDEEHSLVLAFRRLSQDRPRRRALGAAARRWWLEHATPAHAAAVWQRVLDEARRTTPPAYPAGWPAHLAADAAEPGPLLAPDVRAAFPWLEP